MRISFVPAHVDPGPFIYSTMLDLSGDHTHLCLSNMRSLLPPSTPLRPPSPRPRLYIPAHYSTRLYRRLVCTLVLSYMLSAHLLLLSNRIISAHIKRVGRTH